MTLKLINKSSFPTEKIKQITPFKFIECELPLIPDTQGVFGNDSQALYITDNRDDIKGYAGATYVKGAITVYDVKGTLDRLGNIGNLVISLRIKHEILHHFGLPADDLDKWLEDKPLLRLIYGMSSPEKPVGASIQAIYYDELLKDLDIDEFNKKEQIEKRNYQGLLDMPK